MARWQDYVLRGLRADQPSGSLVTIGTLYSVTDEGDIIERWSGTVWEAYSPAVGTGDVVGPAISVNNDVVLFDGVTGKLLKDSGILASSLAVLPINLASQVTGDLPYANFTPSGAASRLLGRGSSGAGDWEEITLGTNLSISGTTLNATGGSSGDVARQTNGFRITLASGQPVYAPQPATAASTDTTNEIVTFSVDPGWYNGTILTPASTIGGLTAGTTYYVHRITSLTFSFHTTVADAMSGANRVNLTANVTQQLNPSGISTTGIYLTPHISNQIALYDGYDWVLMDLAELSVGLGTLSSGKNYDLFVDYNGGVPVLSIGTGWTSDTVRAVDLVRQDGVWVSSADAESRYVGTFRTDSTTTTIDNAGGIITVVGGKRFVWNLYNQVRCASSVFDSTGSWVTNSTTPQQVRATAGNKCEFVFGLVTNNLEATCVLVITTSATTALMTGMGLDVTNAYAIGCWRGYAGAAAAGNEGVTGMWSGNCSLGYHTVYWLESTAASNTTIIGTVNTSQSGMKVTSYY